MNTAPFVTPKTDLMSDVEGCSDISCDPGIINPEEPDMLGSLHHGCRSGGGEDIDPALAVGREHCWLRGRDLIKGNNPLP